MAIERPKQCPNTLRVNTLVALGVCLGSSLVMTVWYYFRYQNSGANDYDIKAWVSLLHIVSYMAFAVTTGVGLFGAFCHKSKLLYAFMIGCLCMGGAEIACIGWTMFGQADKNKRYGWHIAIIKALVVAVIITAAVFAFLWKRNIDKKASEIAQKTGNTGADTVTGDKTADKASDKSEEPKKHKSKVQSKA